MFFDWVNIFAWSSGERPKLLIKKLEGMKREEELELRVYKKIIWRRRGAWLPERCSLPLRKVQKRKKNFLVQKFCSHGDRKCGNLCSKVPGFFKNENKEGVLRVRGLRRLRKVWNGFWGKGGKELIRLGPQRFSNFSVHHNLLEDLLKHRMQGSSPRVSDSAGLGPKNSHF